MIIVRGTSRLVDDADRAEAVEVLARMATASESEPGCRIYRFGFDIEDDRVVHLHEEWEDEFALVAHFDTPHMATYREAIADLVDGATELAVFEAEERALPETG